MHIALFYSGVIRRYRENYDAFKNAFLYDPDKYVVDVYASVNIVDYKSAMEFRHLYGVKQMRIFEFGEEHMPVGPDGDRYNFVDRTKRWTQMSSASMFYHNKCAFDLIAGSGIAYDLVIKSRTDLIDMARFPYSSGYDAGTIYVPGGCGGDYANDQVACGDIAAMAKYCGVFDKIGEYVRGGTNFHPETLLGRHIKDGPVKSFEYAYSLDPARHGDGWTEMSR